MSETATQAPAAAETKVEKKEKRVRAFIPKAITRRMPVITNCSKCGGVAELMQDTFDGKHTYLVSCINYKCKNSTMQNKKGDAWRAIATWNEENKVKKDEKAKTA